LSSARAGSASWTRAWDDRDRLLALAIGTFYISSEESRERGPERMH
jgi:hypothetical protein